MVRLHGGSHDCARYDYSACGFSPVHGNKIAVLEFYLDESGTHHGHDLLTVAGYVADVNKWAEFSAEWKDILDHYRVAFFHAHAFSNGQARIFRHLQRRDRRDLLSALVANIKKTVIAGVFSTVSPSQYKQLTTARFRSEYGTGYSLCVQTCVGALRRFFPASGQDSETVGVFLEEGHNNAMQALQLIKRAKDQMDPIDMSGWEEIEVADSELPPLMPLRDENDPLREKGLKIGAYGLGSKRGMLPLQAADLLAYCLHTEIATMGRDRFSGIVIDDLVCDGLPHYGVHYSEDRIKDLIEWAVNDEKQIAEEKRAAGSVIRELTKFGFTVTPSQLGLKVNFGHATQEGMRKFFPDLPDLLK